MIKAVIIDFDDTLCMTEEACFQMENEALRRMGRAPMSRKVHKATWGQFMADAIETRSPGVDVAEFLKQHKSVHAEWIADNKVDVVEPSRLATLDTLLEQSKKLYILTTRDHREIAHLLAPDHDLATRITTFYYRDVMQFHKPDPRAFDLALKDTGLDRSECVYVGDSASDAVAAKQAHMHFICSLESGLRAETDFEGLQADAFISHFADLPATVALLDKKLDGLA